MSWGSELWDQYDAICTHTEHEIEFIKRVSSFVKERIHAEIVYAKELRKVVKSFRKKEEEESKYTNIQGFGKLVVETNDLAGQRELIAEYLQNEVFKPLNDLVKNTTTERKKMMLEGQKLQAKLKESMDQLENSKRIYRKASEEKEMAAHALDKADNDPQSTKAKIDKLTQISRNKDQIGEECRNNYILQLEATNQYRRQNYTELMPQHMDAFMQMNTNHLNTYKALIAAYAECHRRVQPVINTCLNNITAASDAIDADKDNRQFVEERKTGYPVPGNVDFEEYQGKIKKKEKSDKKDDKKKFEARDYSHLPPEQRRKKLAKRIEELSLVLEKTKSDMTAMEKMKVIYEQNPALGDAQQVSQRLAESRSKIEEIESEIEEFKGYQADLTRGTGDSSSLSVKNGKSPAGSKKKEKTKEKKEDRGKGTSKLSSNDIEVVSNNSSSAAHPSPGGSTDNVKGPPIDEWSDDDNAKMGTMLYDFEAQNEDEITCTANEEVEILEDLGDGWLRVRKGKDEGYVPQSYVQMQ